MIVAGVIFVAACIVGRWLIFDCDKYGAGMTLYYIVRCVNSGAFFARGIKRDGTEAVLEWSRMIHGWEGAAALSQVSVDGIKGGRVCVPVEGRIVLDVCEILPCTEAAEVNLLNQPEWVL